jgi:hypothetical protein
LQQCVIHVVIERVKASIRLLRVLAACGSASVHADVVTLAASSNTQDTTIYQSNNSFSGGGAPAIFVGVNGMGSIRRGFIAFDIVDNLPVGATITGVQLTLILAQTGGATSANIGLYDVPKPWLQGTAGSTAAGISGSGAGFAAGTNDTTWNDEFYSSTSPTPWTSLGGDHAGTASASLALGTNTPNTPFSWLSSSNPQMLTDVQSWLDTPSSNNGWELINANEGTNNTVYEFYSSEWDNAHFGGSATQVPALQVTYTTAPEPASGALTAVAALALLARRPARRLT